MEEIGGALKDKIVSNFFLGNKFEQFIKDFFPDGISFVNNAKKIFEYEKIVNSLNKLEIFATNAEVTTSKINDALNKIESTVERYKELESILGIPKTNFTIPNEQSLNEEYKFNYKNETVNNVQDVYGSALSTTINNGGIQHISNGGIASNTTIDSSGYQYIYNGGIANNTTINSGGIQHISNGGTATSTTIMNSGSQYISSGGKVTYTTINYGGEQYVFSDGVASNTTISNGGYINVSSGGVAENIMQLDGGGISVNLYANDGTKVTGTNVNGSFSYSNGVARNFILNGSMHVSSGGVAINTTIAGGGTQYISSGGLASSTIINNDGSQSISGGSSFFTTINGGVQYVHSGTVISTIIKKGLQFLHNNASSISTTIFKGGVLSFDDNSVLKSIEVKKGGKISFWDNTKLPNSLKINSGGILEFIEYNDLKKFNLNASNRTIIFTEHNQNTFKSITLNSKSIIKYNLIQKIVTGNCNIEPQFYYPMKTLSVNKQNLGNFCINLNDNKKWLYTGVYNLSTNIVTSEDLFNNSNRASR